MTLDRNPSRPRALALVLLGLMIALLGVGAPAAAQDSGIQPFPPADGTTWGSAAALGEGEIKTFVTLDESGVPSLIGIYFDEAALSGLPHEPSDGHWDVKDADGNVVFPCCGHESVLLFPEEAAATPLDHALVNWNPAGHAPAGVYDAPHFDFHFYTTSVEDREAIPPAAADTLCSVPNPPDVGGEHPVPVSCETFEQAVMPLPADQMPPGYMSVGEVIPAMGDHLINVQAPELTGEAPFTHTWVYGAFGGRLTFYEPMVAVSFLEEQNEETCAAIPMPEAMPEAGYYPTQYCIRYLPGDEDGAGAYAISLEEFVEF